MGVCGVMDPNSTYGISWSSSIIKRRPAKLSPAPGRPGCFMYQVRDSGSPVRMVQHCRGLASLGVQQAQVPSAMLLHLLCEATVVPRPSC